MSAAIALALALSATAPQIVIVPGTTPNLDAAARTRLLEAAQTGAQRTKGFTSAIRDVPCEGGSCVESIASEGAAVVMLTAQADGRDYDYRLELIDAAVDAELVVEDSCEVCGLEEVGLLVEGSMATLLERYVRALAPARLTLSTTPVGAEVVEGDAVVGKTPLELELTPGSHTFAISLPGYEAQQRTVSVGSGETLAVDAQLVALPKDRKPWRPLLAGGAVLIAGGVAGVAAGAALIVIDGRPVRCSTAEANEFGVCPRRHTTLEGGAVAVALGGAAIVAGIILEVIAARRRRQPRASARAGGVAVRF